MQSADQRTINLITIIKVVSIALTMIGGMLAVVVLAALHDGEYGVLIVQSFPVVIVWCASALLGMRITDRVTGYLSDRAHIMGALGLMPKPLNVTPPAPMPAPAPTPATVITTTTTTTPAASE